MKKILIGMAVFFVWFMVAVVLLPLTGWTAEPGAAADTVVGYMATAKAIMLFVKDNQELITGFFLAVVAIYGGFQRVRAGAAVSALDTTTAAVETHDPRPAALSPIKTTVKDAMPALGWLARRQLTASVKKLD